MFEWLLFQAQHGATTETLHISRTRATRETQPHSHGRHQPPFPPFPPMHKTTRGKLHRSRIRMDVQRPPHPPPSPPMHRAERETVNIRMDVISPPPSPPPHQCTEQEAKQPHHQPSPAPPSPLLHGGQIHMEVQTGMCEKSRSGGYVRKTNYRPPTTANSSRNNNIQQFVTIAFDNNLENRRLRKLPSRKPRSQVKASLRSASALPTAIQSRFLTVCQLQPQHFWYGVHDVGTPCDPVPGARPC